MEATRTGSAASYSALVRPERHALEADPDDGLARHPERRPA